MNVNWMVIVNQKSKKPTINHETSALTNKLPSQATQHKAWLNPATTMIAVENLWILKPHVQPLGRL